MLDAFVKTSIYRFIYHDIIHPLYLTKCEYTLIVLVLFLCDQHRGILMNISLSKKYTENTSYRNLGRKVCSHPTFLKKKDCIRNIL